MSVLDQPVQLIVVLFALSILPLLVVLGTSFLKLAVVFALLRKALGTQQVETTILAPYRDFLVRNTARTQVRFFADIGHRTWPEPYRNRIPDDSLILLMPAFAVSQLIEAFKIGLLLFLRFVAIDLIVSNVLLAMGMMVVSPMTIALPLKLLVLVLINGWEKLLGQLVLSFS